MTLDHRADVTLKHRLYGSWVDPLGISHRTIARAIERSREYASGRLLDLGCGKKPYLYILAPCVASYIGIEMPNTQSLSSVVDVYASALEIPFKENSFDSILCTEVLEHVPEPKELLRQVKRVLKPNGYLILTAPLTWGPHEVPRDYYRYTEYGLRYLAEQVGFVVEKVERTSGHWQTLGQRASAFVYYHHGWRKPTIIRAPIILLCTVIQLFFSFVDWIYHHQGDTLEYLMIARKV
jgi:SAM-dependent methyltransferase